MKKRKWIILILVLALWLPFAVTVYSASDNYELNFSTFIGGSDKDEMGDITTDDDGNIYVTGCTWSSNFPTTPGAYDRTFNGGPGGSLDTDAYVMKFDSDGNLLWSTYIGGPNTDSTYSIAVDSQGYVYVAGCGGQSFPTTSGAFQETWNGVNAGIYGNVNGVIVKLEPDGSDLAWASYFGTSFQIRDLDIGPSGDVYVIHGYLPSYSQRTYPSSWVTNAYQNSPQGGEDMFVARIKQDGTKVLWGTYLGGSGRDRADGSIAVDASGYVYVACSSESTDIPTTNGFDQIHNGAQDTYVAKLETDGSDLIWGTYLGGSNFESVFGKHGIVIGSQGDVYVGSNTYSSSFPVTSGAYDESFNGQVSGAYWKERGDLAVTKLTTDGALVASTFIGGSYADVAEGISLDQNDNVYLAILTYSGDLPFTEDAYDSTHNGSGDGAFFKLSSDLSQLVYSSYMGTSGLDGFRAICSDTKGNFVAAGTTDSANWPVQNAHQGSYGGGGRDAVLTKFQLLAVPGKLTGGVSSPSQLAIE